MSSKKAKRQDKQITEQQLQSWTKYLEQNGVNQKNWTGKKTFGIYFCVFFNCYLQSLSS